MIKRFIALSVVAVSCFSAQLKFSLPDTISKLNILIEGSRFNGIRFERLTAYQSACNEVLNKDFFGIKTPDHAVYRAYFAGVICAVGPDIFEQHIAPLFSEWKVLKQIIMMPRSFIKNHKELLGTSVYYSLNEHNGRMHVEKRVYFKKQVDLESDQRHAEKYRIINQADDYNLFLVNQCEKNSMIKYLLKAPKLGIVFYHEDYYGAIDFRTKKGTIYHSSKQRTREIDFSHLLIWHSLIFLKATVFFDGNLCCLTFINPKRCNKRTKLSFCLPQQPDLSSPLSYKTD